MDEILAQISEDPAVIETLERDQLTELAAELRKVGREQAEIAKDKDASSADRKAALEAGTEAQERLTAVNTRLEVFAEEDAEIEAKADEISASFDEPEAETEEETPEAETEEPEAEEVVESPEATEEEPVEAIAASAPSIGKLAKRNAPLPKPQGLVASASPGVGAEYQRGFGDANTIGRAMLEAHRSFGSSRIDASVKVASFPREYDHVLQTSDSTEEHARVVDAAIKAYKESWNGKALVASGGVCAPAQPVYDFFSISESAGMVQLPTVGAPRGRLTYPVSPSYASIRASASWSGAAGQQHTNAEDESGASKATFAVTCPTTTTCTIAAFPLILQFGNFAQRFYPESVAHATGESITFRDHFVNATHIAAMVSASTSVTGGNTGGGGLVNVANIVNRSAVLYRDNYRMSPTAVLELVVPAWVIDELVADLVARDSTTSFENARGRVMAVFASLNLNVQAVQDWQSMADAGDDGWRTAADMLLYAPGTFVRMDAGTLDLGIVRDSTLNGTNDFQIFNEVFEGVCEVGHDSWLIDDVTICPTGGTGNRVTLDCNPGFLS